MIKIMVQEKTKRLSFYRFRCPSCNAGVFATNESSERNCFTCKQLLPGAHELTTKEVYKLMYYRKGTYPLVSFQHSFDY